MTAPEESPAPQLAPFPLPRILTYQPLPSTATASDDATSSSSSSLPVLVAQGAEARVYKTTYLTPDRPCALKYRPPKAYRHPVLDARLTRQRILAEARILHRCRREGVPVPALYAVDVDEENAGASNGSNGGSLLFEWIEGGPVRAQLNDWLATLPAPAGADADAEADLAQLRAEPSLIALLRRMGAAVGSLHRVGVVHGDLTTSNLMLRTSAETPEGQASLDGDVVLIDFGLASTSAADEDRAVDLYVLERAFGSTHPRAEALFGEVLQAYGEAFRQSKPVLRKLEDVRMRGRKRSMLG